MYHYNLVCSIFSKQNYLAEIMKQIEPVSEFTYQVDWYEQVDENIVRSTDILIWDLSIEEFKQIKDKIKDTAKVILCVNQYENDLDSIDAILIKPLDSGYAKYHIQKVLNQIRLEEELYYKNTCLNTIIDEIPDMIWIKSLDGIHTLLNQNFCDVVGKSKEDVTGKDHYYIWDVSPDDPNSGADVCKKTEDQVIEAGKTLSFTECVKVNDEIRQLITYKSPLYDRNGKVIGTVGFGHDVTDFKNASVENEILLNSVPYAVLIRDNNGVVINVNSFFETYFNLPKESIIGTFYHDWAQTTFGSDRKINEGGFIEGTTCNTGSDEKVVELRFNNICDIFDNITGQVCVFRDVTLERKLEKQIIQNSNMDFMTKLYNRRYLNQFVSEQSDGTTMNLLAIDLDHFKNINDTYGHKVGDEALILTSKLLKECFPNDLVIRMGGDEFLVVKVGSYDLAQLEKEAKHLLNTLCQHFSQNECFTLLSASIGISQGILNQNNFDVILQHSDSALYEAKEKGRACYCVYKEKSF